LGSLTTPPCAPEQWQKRQNKKSLLIFIKKDIKSNLVNITNRKEFIMWTTLAVVVIVALYAISVYNGLIAGKNQVKEAWATVDTQLKRRYDLIPALIEVVKGAEKHESETLKAVIEARNAAMTATGPDGADAQNHLTHTLKNLFALAESYPNLKANQNFLEMQHELTDTEDKIQATRQFYNTVVMRLNNQVEQFPSNIIARMFGITTEQLFQLDDAERKAPQVKF
jgi:LemA protein